MFVCIIIENSIFFIFYFDLELGNDKWGETINCKILYKLWWVFTSTMMNKHKKRNISFSFYSTNIKRTKR